MPLAGLVGICNQLMGQLAAGSPVWQVVLRRASLPLGCSGRQARASSQEGRAQKAHSVSLSVGQGRPPRLQEVGEQAEGEVATLRYKETKGMGGLFTPISAKSLTPCQGGKSLQGVELESDIFKRSHWLF